MTLPDSIAAYAEDFRDHQLSFQAHLSGRLLDVGLLSPSFYPPSSTWTSAEKDLFFHGLTIYSRLRPDLIARHINTKTTFDVCAYLDVLETASQREYREGAEVFTRRSVEPAMEMSETWIEYEEASSADLLDMDKNDRPLSFVPTSLSGRQSSPDVISDTESSEEEEGEIYGLDHLDTTCLMVLETIIRRAEVNVDNPDNDETFKPDSSDDASGASGNCIVPQEFTESRTSPDKSSLPSIRGQLTRKFSVQNKLKKAFSFSSKSDFLRKLRKRLYMRRRRAEETGRVIVSSSSKLRPGRQKKAKNPPKPRPKTYKTRSKIQLGGTSIEDNSENLSMTIENKPHKSHSPGGMTRPYRVRQFFEDHGINAEVLTSMDLTLFHLSTLARLIRLHRSIYEASPDVDNASISADTIKLLTTITTQFVSEIVRRVVITKEQEVRLKRDLKVWKYEQNEVAAENILESLESMGLGHLRKEDYFARFMEEALEGPSSSQTATLARGRETDSLSSIEQKIMEAALHEYYPSVILPQSLLSHPTDGCQLSSHCDPFAQTMNKEDLQRELEEEEELDKEDESASRTFEESLWERIR